MRNDRTTQNSRRVLVALALAAATGVFGASDARASGAYEVYTCRAPDGSPAPISDATGGWRSLVQGTSITGGNSAEDKCRTGGVLSAGVARFSTQPAVAAVIWQFVAPEYTTLVGYSLQVRGYVRGETSPDHHFGDVTIARDSQADPDTDARWMGLTKPGAFPSTPVEWSGPGTSGLLVRSSCSGFSGTSWNCPPGEDGGVALFEVPQARFTLEDRDAPAISSVSGDATTDRLWAGATGISVGATDQGGGVYRLGVEVDGQIRSWVNLADAPCRAWPGTERTFLSPKPCPSTVGGAQTISTADLPEGTHTVRVLVEDAAGNQTTAYGPTTKTLERSSSSGRAGESGTDSGGSGTDPGPLNGTPAVSDARLRAQWEGREGSARSIKYNGRPVLKGQLTTPNGQPVKDAFVRVTIKRDARNSPAFDRDSLKTDGNGRFRWRLPAGVSSRTITLGYHQRVRDDKPVATTRLTLKVTAGVRLTLSRKTVRRGQTVKLTGKVVGRPVPGVGKLVELQARNRSGRWITFRTVRSRKSGAFAATYRFRNAGPATFQMRARARKSGDYPYATGSSPTRTIRVR
jgi:hypothetical protein